MTMDAEVTAPAEGEAKVDEQAPKEAMPLEGEDERQAALAIVALIDALPKCSSLVLEGLDGEDGIALVCKDAEGNEERLSVSADAIQNAIDEGVEPMADDASEEPQA